MSNDQDLQVNEVHVNDVIRRGREDSAFQGGPADRAPGPINLTETSGTPVHLTPPVYRQGTVPSDLPPDQSGSKR